jgi:peptidoglycan/LPS O-acetylase OafA/YrhL
MLLTGLFFGSYPVSTVTGNSLYGFLNNGIFLNPKMIYHIIGAGMIMYVLLNSEGMQKIFSSPVPLFLGKISYSLYLVHFLVICSFTCALFLALNTVSPYGLAVLTSCILSLLVIVPLSYVFYKYIDTLGVELSKNIYNRLFSPIILGCSGYIQQQRSLSSVYAIYDKLFK